MLPLCAISSSNKRRNGAPRSRRNGSWMSRAQKASAHASTAAPGGSGARRNSGSPPCSIRRRRSVTPNSFRSLIVIGVSQTLAIRPARVVGGGQARPAPLLPAAPMGRVVVVRILTSRNRLAASSRNSRACPRRPAWSRMMVCPGTVLRNASGPDSISRAAGSLQSMNRGPPPGQAGAAFAAPAAARRANSVFPTPLIPTTETTECLFHASEIRNCQYLRETTSQ